MRIKARASGSPPRTTPTTRCSRTPTCCTPVCAACEGLLDTHGRDVESWKKEGHTYYRVRGPLVPKLHVNEFVFDESGDKPLYALVKETSGRLAVLRDAAREH